jgi:DNA-binding response OmpR family regulator
MIANSHLDHQPTLLLIEDDELVRDAMTRLFVREGYLVLTAATGHDAIGVLRTPSPTVDVVLLDVGLPDVSGADLCARIRQFFPDLPVVVCTGAASREEVEELHRQNITCFFSKPTALGDLVAAVHTAYRERSPH